VRWLEFAYAIWSGQQAVPWVKPYPNHPRTLPQLPPVRYPNYPPPDLSGEALYKTFPRSLSSPNSELSLPRCSLLSLVISQDQQSSHRPSGKKNRLNMRHGRQIRNLGEGFPRPHFLIFRVVEVNNYSQRSFSWLQNNQVYGDLLQKNRLNRQVEAWMADQEFGVGIPLNSVFWSFRVVEVFQ
jgi:hypothetical protein